MQQPPENITRNVSGQQRVYHYMTTVNSLDGLDKFRFENFCKLSNSFLHTFKKAMNMGCSAAERSNCDFELRALRPDLESDTIHVYSYSQHNHPIKPAVERSLHRSEEELLPDEDPPKDFWTEDNIEWAFLRTVSDDAELHKFRLKNHCKIKNLYTGRNITRIRFYCNNEYGKLEKDCDGHLIKHCYFMLLAMKNTEQRYHVYKYGEHECKEGHQKEEEDEPIGPEQHDDEEEQQEEEQMETDEREYPLERCERHLESNLREFEMERTKKWMSRIDQPEIVRIIAKMDVENVANLMTMANIDICNSEARLDFWLPWIDEIIGMRGTEMAKFIMSFKNVESLPARLRAKLQKILDKRQQPPRKITGNVRALNNHRLVSKAIRKRIQLTIKNCPHLFTKHKFRVISTPIELVGFKWSLQATRKEKGFLAMYLHAEPPDGFHENYLIEVDWRISILNAFTGKDLVREETGYIYTKKVNNRNGRGCRDMAKFEELLDPGQTFLTPEGNVDTWVDFTIKSSTLDNSA